MNLEAPSEVYPEDTHSPEELAELQKPSPQAPEIKEKCPNCIKPNPEIEPMSNGKCGVCDGTGEITWKDTGIKLAPAHREGMRWREEFDDLFEWDDFGGNIGECVLVKRRRDYAVEETERNELKSFISNLLSQRDATIEHCAEPECPEYDKAAHERGRADSEIKLNKIKQYLEEAQKYCEEENGRDYCKNCGLEFEELLEIITSTSQ